MVVKGHQWYNVIINNFAKHNKLFWPIICIYCAGIYLNTMWPYHMYCDWFILFIVKVAIEKLLCKFVAFQFIALGIIREYFSLYHVIRFGDISKYVWRFFNICSAKDKQGVFEKVTCFYYDLMIYADFTFKGIWDTNPCHTNIML